RDRLRGFVGELEKFARPHGVLERMTARREFARTVRERSVTRVEADWDRTIAAIAGSGRYGGLAMQPIVGLLPLGPDPQSGLQEFAHLQSGTAPRRGSDGRLAL